MNDGAGHAAEDMLRDAEAAGASPERVAAIKQAIAEGRYQLNPDAIAKALIASGELSGD
jgi:flagellar biosynthesis anti-sigma factor FlgM